jgi:putative transposase
MARISRVVVPGLPHHVTQHGVRSVRIFTRDSDRRAYLALMREQGERFGLSFLAWCLMSNHVHLVAVPKREESLLALMRLEVSQESPRNPQESQKVRNCGGGG